MRFEISAAIAGDWARVEMVKCDVCPEETVDDGVHTRSWLRAELMGDLRVTGDYFGEERHFCSPACAVLALARVA